MSSHGFRLEAAVVGTLRSEPMSALRATYSDALRATYSDALHAASAWAVEVALHLFVLCVLVAHVVGCAPPAPVN